MKWKLRIRLMKPSTRLFIQEARQTKGYSFFDWLHGYVYARWPYLYIGIGTGEHRLVGFIKPVIHGVGKVLALFKRQRFQDRPEHLSEKDGKESPKATFADTYHGKVVPLNAAEELVTMNREISLTNLEQIIPYSTAKDIILKNPEYIVVLDCPCRVVRSNPCLPLDVCLIVGNPIASFVLEHHPKRSRRISAEEAVEILRDEEDRGHVHHAFFKDAMLGRFYAICNCCACCCGAMQARRNGIPMLAESGYVIERNEALCDACGECIPFCQFSAITIEEGKTICDATLCMGCGVCVSKCSKQALSLIHDPDRGAPLKIRDLMDQAVTAE
jgi:Pyruvate/2-oxoacid:ferredoxin oxidoreductase delta subunit